LLFPGRRATIALCVLFLAACSYSSHLGIRQHLHSKESRTTLIAQLEEEDSKQIDDVVRLLNLGMVYRLDGQYHQSIGKWEAAKRIIQEQRAASITEGITSFFVNNTTESFSPNATEEQNLHILQAANFLDLGKPDGARVEILQREQLIKEYPPELRYPFADYFAGMVFELNHEPDQALVSYRRAFKEYARAGAGAPEALLRDYARLLDYLGERGELEALLQNRQIDYPKERPNLTILVAHGLAPEKVENRFMHFSNRYNNSFSIVLPAYPPSQPYVPAGLSINGAEQALARVSNIDAMVRYELSLSQDSLLAQAIIRQVAKRGIATAIAGAAANDRDSRGGFSPSDLLVFALSEALVHATESADLRSWNSLPAGIDIYRAHHKPGSYLISSPNTQPITVELQHAAQVLRLVHQPDA